MLYESKKEEKLSIHRDQLKGSFKKRGDKELRKFDKRLWRRWKWL